MTAVAISRVRTWLGVKCGVVLVLGGLTHLAVNLTAARTSRPDSLLPYAVLVVSPGPLSARADSARQGSENGASLGTFNFWEREAVSVPPKPRSSPVPQVPVHRP